MQLSKFPVVGRYGEYQVRISEDNWFDQYVFEVYTEKKFLKILPYWSLLSSKGLDREDWRGKYIALAKDVVDSYETWLEKQWKLHEIEQKGIEKWNQWDGK